MQDHGHCLGLIQAGGHLVGLVELLIELNGCIMAAQPELQLRLKLQLRDLPAWSHML